MISKEEFIEITQLVCPHCRGGMGLRQRNDTREWVHGSAGGDRVSQTICWASGFRNSRFAEVLKDG